MSSILSLRPRRSSGMSLSRHFIMMRPTTSLRSTAPAQGCEVMNTAQAVAVLPEHVKIPRKLEITGACVREAAVSYMPVYLWDSQATTHLCCS